MRRKLLFLHISMEAPRENKTFVGAPWVISVWDTVKREMRHEDIDAGAAAPHGSCGLLSDGFIRFVKPPVPAMRTVNTEDVLRDSHGKLSINTRSRS